MQPESALIFPQDPATVLEPDKLFPYFFFLFYLRSILMLILSMARFSELPLRFRSPN
jgi:hypothetical protein